MTHIACDKSIMKTVNKATIKTVKECLDDWVMS